jgi:predicted RNase H-like HicB family nuclease
MDYEILIYCEGGVWVAEAPELPGCAAHGTTKAAALASIESLIPEWIAAARESGIPIPEPAGRVAVPA